MSDYTTLGELVVALSEAFQPPERLTVSESAEKYRYINNPGSYVGPWKNSTAPYLKEVMDCFTDREHEAVIFCAPAQCGKTEVFLNWVAHGVLCDPMDMLLVEKSQVSARDFSRRRVDRLHRHTPVIGERILPGNSGDNVFDKMYRNGMLLTLSWPSINELSGRPVGRVFLTDYDRMPQDVDGEGAPFDLAHKRTTTFRSSRKTVAESSPGFIAEDPRWLAATAHEAPPCRGILALYNRGDRRRWYWKCPHCKEWFEPSFSLLQWSDTQDTVEAGKSAMMVCPHCATLLPPEAKYDLNQTGRWVRDGQTLTKSDKLEGLPYRSSFASFWLKGVAAAFAPWSSLVANYIRAEQEYQRTGSQEALKATVNTDQGEPYVVRGSQASRLPDDLKNGATNYVEREVPPDVRFLIATADVQKNRFVVQVFGIAPAKNNLYGMYVIDRIDIIKSNRLDEDGERLWVKPHMHLEDWHLLKERVLDLTYPLMGQDGEMAIKLMLCDSGGADGVTHNAYAFWERLSRAGDNDHRRFMLVKGQKNPAAPRVEITYPDTTNRKDRKAGARGNVPVMMLNVNMLKDRLDGMVDLPEGEGGVHIPSWMPDEVFTEMTTEVRTPKGWENRSRKRNEAWDLATYCIGACTHLGVDRFDWEGDRLPAWAMPWPDNSLVQLNTINPATGESKPFAKEQKHGQDLASLAAKLG